MAYTPPYTNDPNPLSGNMDAVIHVGIQGPRGPQGDPFTYEDFTPEQLEGLRAPAVEAAAIANTAAEAANTAALRAEDALYAAELISAESAEAVKNANNALENAASAIGSCNDATNSANRATEDANTATASATASAGNANEATDSARAAAAEAVNAAQKAENASVAANDAAARVDESVNNAATAANAANSAAENANSAATTASNAANLADSAAKNAEDAASAANAAAENTGAAIEETLNAKNTFLETAGTALAEIREVVNDGMDAPPIVCNTSGSVISIDDSANRMLQGMKVYGKTTQNGTPTPEAPVPLESVGDDGSVGVTVTGKNLFGGDAFADKLVSVANGKKNEENGTVNVTAAQISGKVILEDVFKENTPYTIILKCHSPSTGYTSVLVRYTDGTSETITGLSADETKTLVKVTNANKTVKWLIGANRTNNTFYYNECGIFEGVLTADDFEPYNGQTLTTQKPTDVPVFLPGIPLVDIGTAITVPADYTDENGQQWFCDYVDFNRGVYVQRIAKKVLDGTESWSKPGSTHHGVKIGAFGSIISGVQLSSHFVGTRVISSNNNIGVYVVNSEAQNGAYICIRRQVESMTNDEFKALLAENPVTVYYALKTPIEHTLSAEELAQYASLHTNYPNTTIFNDAGADMEVKYVADTKLYIDKKFAELSTALLNQ